MMKKTSSLVLVVLVALFVAGCTPMHQAKKRNSREKIKITGTQNDLEREQEAFKKAGAKKGEARLVCTREPATGSRIRKKRCWFYEAAERERQENIDAMNRWNNRGNRFGPGGQ